MRLSHWICGLLCLCVVATATAQKSVETQLQEAAALYERGSLRAALQLLERLEAGSISEQRLKVQLYRQMTLCYLFLNYDDSLDTQAKQPLKLAEDSYFKLLRTDNIYVPDTNEVIDYLHFTRQFTATPRWLITPLLGVTGTYADVLESYSVGALPHYYDTVPQSGIPYAPVWSSPVVGLQVDWQASRAFSVAATLGYAQRSTLYRDTLALGEPFAISFQERQQWLDASLQANLQLGNSKIWMPYLYAGAAYHRLFHSTFTGLTRAYAELDPQLSLTNPDHDGISATASLEEVRHLNNYSLIAGAGLRWRVFDKHFLQVQAQYGRMIAPIKNVQDRYSAAHADLWNYQYGYVNDDIRYNHFTFQVGYAYALYRLQRRPI